jgi:predicted DNA-binding protein
MISNAKGNQVQVTSYYEPEAVRQLKALSKATRIPQAAYLREALEDLLRKHAATSRKATK